MRSIELSRRRPRRSRPNGSVAGASAIVPVSSTAFVTPLMVSSPLASTRPPSRRLRSLALKVISGKRCPSKKSGVCRCPFRFSSFTSTDATFAEPVSVSPDSTAVNSVKPPRKLFTPA